MVALSRCARRASLAGGMSSLDDTVRKYLKKDEHIVLAILGLYATVYGMVKIKGMLTSKPVPKKEAPKALASKMSGLGVSFEVKGGEGASVTSAKWGFEFPTTENFDEWEKNEENWKAWEAWVDSPKFEEWANSDGPAW